MDLLTLGAQLREERERRGLSLEEVSDRIKISGATLAAIEDGDEGKLPHPVYAKGFIRNYARLLDIYSPEFKENLAQIFDQEEAPLQPVPLLEDIPDEDSSRGGGGRSSLRVKRIALVVVAFIVLAGGLWAAHSLFSSSSETGSTTSEAPVKDATPAPAQSPAPVQPAVPEAQPAAAPTQAPALAPQAAATPAPAPVQTPASAPVAPATQEPAVAQPAPNAAANGAPAAPEPTPEDRATQAIALSGPTANAEQPAAPTAPAAAPAPAGKQFTVGDHGSHEVTITAKDRCWIQAGADGGTMRDSMLAAGDTFTGKFSDYLLVRLGNAGAVEIHFDGKLYPLRAGKGSVKTLKFLGRNADAATSGATAPQAAATPATPEKAGAEKPVTPEAAVAEKPAAAPAGGQELEVFGKDGSWVILTPDNNPPKEVYVKKGQRLTVPFNEKIEVKLGNPSSVVFRYNGTETPATTERGGTKTLRFP